LLISSHNFCIPALILAGWDDVRRVVAESERTEDCGSCTLNDPVDGAALAGCDPGWNAGNRCCSVEGLLLPVDSVEAAAEVFESLKLKMGDEDFAELNV